MEGKDWAMHPPHWVAKKLAWTRFTQTVLHNVRVAVELSVAPTPEDRRAVNLLLHDSPALVTRTSMDWYGQLLPLHRAVLVQAATCFRFLLFRPFSPLLCLPP